MKILFTGATSFTGLWFVKSLASKNHQILSLVKRKREAYEGLRKERLELLEKVSEPIFQCEFGDELCLRTIDAMPEIDLFCHHAADVTDYKSPDFNPVQALASNSKNIVAVLRALKNKGCRRLILTGSVFEPGEGAGSDHLRAVSPYGLSKGLTSELFTYYAEREGIELAKFVIPNPFGPYEEVRFTTFLAREWLQGKTAPVTMPSYVRDNIHVSLLADAYADFAVSNQLKLNPSGYPESQGAFVLRFARAMAPRLNKACEVDFKVQTDFPEPKVRINTDLLTHHNEEKAWDELARFYLKTYA